MKRLLLLSALLLSLAPFSPAAAKTDTLYFEFALQKGETSATIEYGFSNAVRSGIQMEYYDGQEHAITPTASGSITVTGNGYGRIYYTYGASTGYSAIFSPDNSGEDIRLSGVHLTSLDVHGCTALTYLDCNNNQLTSLDVSSNTLLEFLDCSYNQLATLDVTANTALTVLHCYENQLTGLDVSQNTSLTSLWCYGNQLTALDVSANTGLRTLYCNNNQLTSLDVTALTNLDVTALTNLDCGNNHLPLSTLYGIYAQGKHWVVFIAENQTDTVSLASCQALNLGAEKTLGGKETTYTLKNAANQIVSSEAYTQNNFSFQFNEPFTGTLKLQNTSVRNASMTYHITAEGCATEPEPTPETKTDTLYFEFALEEGTTSATIDYAFTETVLPSIQMEYNDGEKDYAKFSPTATSGSITIKGNGHGRIYYSYEESTGYSAGFSSPYSISDIRVTLSRVKLTSLDVHNCTALTSLYCSNNQLTVLDVSANPALEILGCNNNQLTGLDVSQNTALTDLLCDENQLTVLDVSANTKLAYLSCNNNQLTALDVSKNPKLSYLDCHENHLALSTLYGIYAQRADWYQFYAANQTDTLTVGLCRALDLSSEKTLGGTTTTFELKDKDGNSVSSDAYTENDFRFQFHNPATYTLTLQNTSVPRASMTYHITAEGCATEPPTPTTSHTDTLYFEFALETSSALIWYEFSDDVFPGIEMEYYDGEEYAKFKPTATESITVNGNGYGRIYYTYEESTGYSAGFSSFYSISDIDIRVTLSGVKLTSLDVHACAALTDLECYMNQLTSLNVSGCTKLTSLGCGNNQLTSLDVSGCTALTTLTCGYNQLTTLDVSHNTLLEELSCFNNQLTGLDVHACTALTSLYCSGNQLTDLDVSHNPDLKNLYCGFNQLTSLDVSHNTLLEELSCFNNQLTSLDVSHNTRLDQLQCANNQLTSLDVSGCTALKTLNCGNNHLPLSTLYDIYAQRADWSSFYAANQTDTLALASCQALDLGTEKEFDGTVTTDTLRNAANQIVSSEAYTQNNFSFLFKDPFIGTLTLQNTSLPDASMTYHITAAGCASEPPTPTDTHTDTLYFEFALEAGADSASIEYAFTSAVLPGIQMEYNDGQEHPQFTPGASGKITVKGNGHGRIYYTYKQSTGYSAYLSSIESFGTVKDITLYRLSGVHLTSLDVHACIALKELYCGNNQLATLDVSANTALTVLYCYENQLTTLDVSGNTLLELLDCSSNQLATLDVSHNPALTALWCHKNQLATLDVSHNPALTALWCYKNQLTTLDVSADTALTALRCYDNQLTSLDVSGNTALYYFDCDNNQLSVLDVNDNLDLRSLYCSNNQLTNLDVSGCPALTTLSCGNNHLPLSTLYGIYAQRADWSWFTATNQTYTLALASCQALNLGTEKEFDGTATTFALEDADGNSVSAEDYTENDFRFQVHTPAIYTLTLQNTSVPNASMTYYLTVEECFTISVSSNNEAWGWATKTGDGAYIEGSSVTIIATPRAGYRFVNWTKDGEEYSTEAAHTFAVTENLTLVANFEEIPPVVVETFTLSISANNDTWGSVSQSGNGTYEKDATATITATPAEGYRFLNWTKEGAIFCHQADTTFAVTENLTLVANFEEIPPVVVDDFTIILTPNNPAWGRVLKTGNCTYGQGEEITILALPFAGCRFVNWTKADGSVFATDSLYTFKVTENLELTANFERLPDAPEVETFTVNVSANNDAWGIVSQSGEGTYEKDSSVTITATPAEGYRFVNWTKDGDVFGTASDTTFAVTEDLTLVANFEEVKDEKPTEDDIHIYVKDNTIYLPANKGKVEIFNVIGQCMYSGHATAVHVRQTGVYIVCIAGQNHKVLVM